VVLKRADPFLKIGNQKQTTISSFLIPKNESMVYGE